MNDLEERSNRVCHLQVIGFILGLGAALTIFVLVYYSTLLKSERRNTVLLKFEKMLENQTSQSNIVSQSSYRLTQDFNTLLDGIFGCFITGAAIFLLVFLSFCIIWMVPVLSKFQPDFTKFNQVMPNNLSTNES